MRVIAAAQQKAVAAKYRETMRLTGAFQQGQPIIADNPIDLDEHRGMAAQKSTEIRRRLHEVQADQAALRHRQEEFEKFLLAAPATSWPEAAAKARYLIQLFAATPDAKDPRRQKLIASALEELARLSDGVKEDPKASQEEAAPEDPTE